jgi:hypothetical protein
MGFPDRGYGIEEQGTGFRSGSEAFFIQVLGTFL